MSPQVDTALAVLRPLTELGRTQKEILGERVTAGLFMMLKLNGSLIRDRETWQVHAPAPCTLTCTSTCTCPAPRRAAPRRPAPRRAAPRG